MFMPSFSICSATNRDRLQVTMLGVGYVFPTYVGLKRMTSLRMRKCRLEWLYHWQQEPL